MKLKKILAFVWLILLTTFIIIVTYPVGAYLIASGFSVIFTLLAVGELLEVH